VNQLVPFTNKNKKEKKGARDKPNWLKVADGHTHFIIPRYRVFNF
jgi:hypothetical protein